MFNKMKIIRDLSARRSISLPWTCGGMDSILSAWRDDAYPPMASRHQKQNKTRKVDDKRNISIIIDVNKERRSRLYLNDIIQSHPWMKSILITM